MNISSETGTAVQTLLTSKATDKPPHTHRATEIKRTPPPTHTQQLRSNRPIPWKHKPPQLTQYEADHLIAL